MNTQERIEKMLNKAEKILQADKPKPNNLKPCPFCGSKDVEMVTEIEEWECGDETDWQEWSYVRCNNCDGQLGKYFGDEQASEAWNSGR